MKLRSWQPVTGTSATGTPALRARRLPLPASRHRMLAVLPVAFHSPLAVPWISWDPVLSGMAHGAHYRVDPVAGVLKKPPSRKLEFSRREEGGWRG